MMGNSMQKGVDTMKMRLAKETLRNLDSVRLTNAVGGAHSDRIYDCPDSTTPYITCIDCPGQVNTTSGGHGQSLDIPCQ